MEWVFLILVGAVGGIIWQAMKSSGGGWSTSTNGNPTRIYRGSRVTVFPSDGGWKFCIADPDDDDDPYFSDPYSTLEAAKHEAIALIDGTGSKFSTKREERSGKLRDEAESLVSKEAERLRKLEASVRRALSKSPPQPTTLQNLQLELTRRARSSDHLHSQLIEASGRDDHMDHLAKMTKRYWELKWQIDEALKEAP